MSQTIKIVQQKDTERSNSGEHHIAKTYDKAKDSMTALKKDPTLQDVNNNKIKEMSSNDSDHGPSSVDDINSKTKQAKKEKKQSAFFGQPDPLMLSDESDSQATSQQNTVHFMDTPHYKPQHGGQYPYITLETLGKQFDQTHGYAYGNVNDRAEMLVSFKEDFEE